MMRRFLEKVQRVMKAAFSGNKLISWMMLAALVPMLLVVYFSYNLAKDTLYRTINRDISVAMKKKVVRIDNYIAERKLDLLQLSKIPSLLTLISNHSLGINNTEAIEKFRNYLKFVAPKTGIANVYLIELGSKLIFTLNPGRTNAGDVLSEHYQHTALYRAFLGAKILRIPFVHSEFTKERSSIYVSVIVTEQDIMQAVLVVRLDIDSIQRMLNQAIGFVKSETSFLATLLDNKPKIVMQSNSAEKINHNDALMMKFLAYSLRGGTGYPYWNESQKNPFVITSDYQPQLNMGLLVKYDESEIYAKVYWYKMRMFFLVGISILIVFSLVFWVSHALRSVTKKNENLLASILPKFVIEELNEKKRFIARNVDNVSIVFIDIVDFTGFASRHSPEEVVAQLDELFSILDTLCDQYQLEKIKTIGDAHMSASGLITHQENHANRAVEMALAAILAVKHYNLDHGSDFSLRAGIDSGRITAGIIGRRKPGYDIWGHVVNRASRMESFGVVNQVQITEASYHALIHPENYRISLRSGVMIKGMGVMDTYLVDALVTDRI